MTTETKKHSKRSLKFAEAGILFVLLLGVIIAVGVKMGGGDEPVVVTQAPDTRAMADAVVEAAEIVVEEPAVEEIVEPEPAPEPTLAERYDASVSPTVIYQDGESAYFDRSYDEASDLFAIYTERRPNNAWGHYMLGLSLWKAGAAEDAEIALVRSLDLSPDHVKSLVNLARVRLELARADEALLPVETALAIDPEYTDGYRVLGRVLHNLDRRDEAVDAYHEALFRRADDAWALNNVGLILLEMDRPAEALAPLARAAGLAPETAVIANNLGMALERAGHAAQAVEAYTTAADAGHAKAEVSLARLEDFIAAGGSAGETLDLAAVAASFEALPRYAAESAGNDGAVDHAPDSTASAVADSAAVAEASEVALGGGL